jgi:hypothetical protein
MLKSLASARGHGGRPFKIAAKLWLAHASQPVRGEDRRCAKVTSSPAKVTSSPAKAVKELLNN